VSYGTSADNNIPSIYSISHCNQRFERQRKRTSYSVRI